ncbi:hypothetical protein C8R44DRAFT_743143 [Mycena epipterygia]|nr:hypothetical protein C8R44DRAFT_743143 [Mycena epipterygia]
MSRTRREEREWRWNTNGAIAPPNEHLLKERLIHIQYAILFTVSVNQATAAQLLRPCVIPLNAQLLKSKDVLELSQKTNASIQFPGSDSVDSYTCYHSERAGPGEGSLHFRATPENTTPHPRFPSDKFYSFHGVCRLHVVQNIVLFALNSSMKIWLQKNSSRTGVESLVTTASTSGSAAVLSIPREQRAGLSSRHTNEPPDGPRALRARSVSFSGGGAEPWAYDIDRKRENASTLRVLWDTSVLP